MNVALLTAAGTGSRMRQDIPKQFLHVDNKPIIIYTMEAFQAHPSIDAIIVVVLDKWQDILWAYAKQFNITKLKWLVTGGDSGQASIQNGIVHLNQVCQRSDVVVIHDGNRPLVSADIISDSIATYGKYGNAVAAIPCTEVVFKSADGVSSNIHIAREELLRTQTPHTYSLGDLLDIHGQAKDKSIVSTAATCQLMCELGRTTYFSKGEEKNIKITTTEDIELFKSIKNTRNDTWIK